MLTADEQAQVLRKVSQIVRAKVQLERGRVQGWLTAYEGNKTYERRFAELVDLLKEIG